MYIVAAVSGNAAYTLAAALFQHDELIETGTKMAPYLLLKLPCGVFSLSKHVGSSATCMAD